jgi:aspartyl/glutamyl-tRNA(Asn/Gln) amidotransferase C subunit
MISNDDIKHLGDLARLAIPEAEMPVLQRDLDKIVNYVSELGTLPKVLTGELGRHNVWRSDDNPTPAGTWTEKILTLAPDREGNYLRVKKIIER